MSARAVLNTVYSLLAQNADSRDDASQAAGKPEDATHRAELDKALGIAEDLLGDEDTKTNVVELRAWIDNVNRTMV